MKKRKILQHSLWLTALVATVLFCHTPFGLIKPLWLLSFIVLVLLPQVIAIILQFREVHERYIDMVGDNSHEQYDKIQKKPLCAEFITVYTNTYAMLKSQGINPNRAGPLLCA